MTPGAALHHRLTGELGRPPVWRCPQDAAAACLASPTGFLLVFVKCCVYSKQCLFCTPYYSSRLSSDINIGSLSAECAPQRSIYTSSHLVAWFLLMRSPDIACLFFSVSRVKTHVQFFFNVSMFFIILQILFRFISATRNTLNRWRMHVHDKFGTSTSFRVYIHCLLLQNRSCIQHLHAQPLFY